MCIYLYWYSFILMYKYTDNTYIDYICTLYIGSFLPNVGNTLIYMYYQCLMNIKKKNIPSRLVKLPKFWSFLIPNSF